MWKLKFPNGVRKMWLNQDKMFKSPKKELEKKKREQRQREHVARELDHIACKILDGEYDIDKFTINHNQTNYMNDWQYQGSIMTLEYNQYGNDERSEA